MSNIKKSEKDKKKFSSKDEIQLAIMFAEGYSKRELQDFFGITYERVNKTLKKKLVSMVIKDRQEQIRKTLFNAYTSVDKKFKEMVDIYTDEALLDERIEKTPLRDLFSVLSNLSNRYENLQKYEIELQKLEIERQKLELEKLKYKKDEKKDSNGENGTFEKFFENIELLAKKIER